MAVYAFIDPKRLKVSKYQPRIEFNLEELLESIKNEGIKTEIQVNEHDNGDLVVFDGDRRRQCALELQKHPDKKISLKFKEVPIIIKKLSDREEEEAVIINNVKRKDFNKIEIARALNNYKTHWKENDKNIDNIYLGAKFFPELSQEIKNNTTSGAQMVGRYLKLLELPPEVQEIVANKKFAFGKAYQLTLLKFDEDEEPEDWKRRRIQHQINLTKSGKTLIMIKKEVTRLKNEEKLYRTQVNDDIQSKENILSEYNRELKQAIINFLSVIKIDYPIPEDYTKFKINDLKQKKDKIINSLQEGKTSEENIELDKKIVDILKEFIYIIPKHKLLEREFDLKRLKKIQKDIEVNITKSLNKNHEIEEKIYLINTKWSSISYAHIKIQKFLLNPESVLKNSEKENFISAFIKKLD